MQKKPKGKRPKTKTEIKLEVEIPSPTTVYGDRAPQLSQIRFQAGLHYAVSRTTTWEEFRGLDQSYSKIKDATFERWRREDQWDKYRDKIYAGAMERVSADLEKELADSLHLELQHLRTLEAMSITLLSEKDKNGNPALKPKSWEGVAQTLMRIDKRRSELAHEFRSRGINKTADKRSEGSIFDFDAAEEEVMTIDAEFSDAEVREAARQIMAQRRERRVLPETTERTDN